MDGWISFLPSSPHSLPLSLHCLGLGHLQWNNGLPKGGCQLYAGCSWGRRVEEEEEGMSSVLLLGESERQYVVDSEAKGEGEEARHGGLEARGPGREKRQRQGERGEERERGKGIYGDRERWRTVLLSSHAHSLSLSSLSSLLLSFSITHSHTRPLSSSIPAL